MAVPTTTRIRDEWQGPDSPAIASIRLTLCDRALYNMGDDSDELRLCWCCAKRGYQEKAHIVPRSLGGSDDPENLFLLCAECHTSAPDVADPDAFIGWVNAESVRQHAIEMQSIDRLLSAMIPAVESKDDASEMLGLLECVMGKAELSCTTHSADISNGTRRARMEMAGNAIRKEVESLYPGRIAAHEKRETRAEQRLRQFHGIAKAKAEGRYQGKPRDMKKRAKIAWLLDSGLSIRKVAEVVGASPSTVNHVKQNGV